MANKFIYNNSLDDIALDQLAQFEEAEKTSLEAPTYRRLPLDSRDLEILIDCLEAGAEAYEDDENASVRIARIIRMLKED
jgi:hypothetical protein